MGLLDTFSFGVLTIEINHLHQEETCQDYTFLPVPLPAPLLLPLVTHQEDVCCQNITYFSFLLATVVGKVQPIPEESEAGIWTSSE